MNNNYQGNQNRNQGNQNRNQQPKREKAKLVVEPSEFDGLLKSKLTTTLALSRQVNALFRPVFSDFEGSIVTPNQFGQLDVTLFFKDKGNAMDGQIKSLVPVTETVTGGGAIDRIMRMNLRNSAKSYDFSEETKEVLSDFIYTRGNSNPKWKEHIYEQTEQNYNGYTIYVKVLGIDIVRVLKKIYGNKVNGSFIDYNVSIIKPIGVDNSGANQNYLVNIQQLDSKQVEKLANEIGIIPVSGSIQMVR